MVQGFTSPLCLVGVAVSPCIITCVIVNTFIIAQFEIYNVSCASYADCLIFQVSVKTNLGDILERVSRCKKAVVNLERKVWYRHGSLCFTSVSVESEC